MILQDCNPSWKSVSKKQQNGKMNGIKFLILLLKNLTVTYMYVFLKKGTHRRGSEFPLAQGCC